MICTVVHSLFAMTPLLYFSQVDVKSDVEEEEAPSSPLPSEASPPEGATALVERVARVPARKYACDECGFATSRVREMTKHRRRHMFAANTCYYCDARLTSHAELEAHMTQVRARP